MACLHWRCHLHAVQGMIHKGSSIDAGATFVQDVHEYLALAAAHML